MQLIVLILVLAALYFFGPSIRRWALAAAAQQTQACGGFCQHCGQPVPPAKFG
jgi:hypothetical protein